MTKEEINEIVQLIEAFDRKPSAEPTISEKAEVLKGSRRVDQVREKFNEAGRRLGKVLSQAK